MNIEKMQQREELNFVQIVYQGNRLIGMSMFKFEISLVIKLKG